MKKLLPLIMLLVGTGAGVGAGIYLRPAEPLSDAVQAPESQPEYSAQNPMFEQQEGKEYVRLKDQFVVPVVKDDRISSMVVMSLSLEVPEGKTQDALAIEPKIRDEFLMLLFDLASVNIFDGNFLKSENLEIVRRELNNTVKRSIGEELVSDVLIYDIARQDY